MSPELRFSTRVDAYVAGRPGYPDQLAARVRSHLGLPEGARVADLGSGTGLLSEVFLASGHPVVGVEPDDQMARAAVARLAGARAFVDQRGSAEATGLPDRSVDLLVVGQAFHWFDPRAARAEALRILRDPPRAALIWNERPRHAADPACTPLLAAYEALVVRHDLGTYRATEARWSKVAPMQTFFGGAVDPPLVLHHVHHVTLDALVARASSCSYLPGTGHPGHAALVADLTALFDAHAEGATVPMAYRTQAFCGRLR